MSDNLRDRIAAAITGIRIQRDGDSYQMADAVIRELGIDDPLSAHRLRMCADTMDAYWASVGEEYDSDTLREEAELEDF